MATPANKRRRLASDTLSKPFKSPFKTPLKHVDDQDNTAARPNTPITPITQSIPTTPVTKTYRPTPGASSLLQSDPDISALQKRHTKLLNQLSTLRSELDTYTQALKIETSNNDAELEELVVIWKTASRAAAEEVFAGARDRVNRMGGLRGLREREQTRNEGLTGWGWDQEKTKKGPNSDGEEFEGEERDPDDRCEGKGDARVDDDDNDDNVRVCEL